MDDENLTLKKTKIASAPFIDKVMRDVDLRSVLEKHISHRRYITAIEILIKSHLMEPAALYRIPELAKQFGWGNEKINDDLLARALDAIFKSDKATLQTELILKVISTYKLDTSIIHNDSTSIKFFGAYEYQAKRSVKLKRGHSKDHRPDLKQIIYNLCVCGDGAVPIHFKCYDGNKTDDTLHIETWLTLRGMLGKSDFIYVGDSKLATSENMRKIDQEQGYFVTIIPKTRSEVKEFYQECYDGEVRWKLLTKYASTRKKGEFNVYQVSEDFHQLSEGFKMFWYRSFEKKRQDKASRNERITSALAKLEDIQNGSRRGPKTQKSLLKVANNILNRFKVTQWIQVEAKSKDIEEFVQESPGKPGPDTKYNRKIRKEFYLVVKKNHEMIARSKSTDGVFPLVTNTKMDAKETLQTYKYQPRLEKHFSYMKSDYQVAPVFLKKTERIEAIMFVCFLSDLIAAIVQRQLRGAMKEANIDKIQTLPEERPTATPTWEQIQRLFAHYGKQELMRSGTHVTTFWDDLNPHQNKVLELMDLSKAMKLEQRSNQMN